MLVEDGLDASDATQWEADIENDVVEDLFGYLS